MTGSSIVPTLDKCPMDKNPSKCTLVILRILCKQKNFERTGLL